LAQNNWNSVYFLACGAADLRAATAEEVGNKAANLIRMAKAGLPVPAGFVLPTGMCREYFAEARRLPEGFAELLAQSIKVVEKATALTFAGDRRPLLVSVRSGAAASMPGMMDTILNVGLCDRTLPALIRMTGNPRHAWDSYRRLVQAYAEIARGLAREPFDRLLAEALKRQGILTADELDVAALRELTLEFLRHFQAQTGEPFPQDPLVQLARAVEAVFRSWESPRAVAYRRLHGLEGLAGTAVTGQAMVFGNMGGTSGSGVAFTRDPMTGENRLFLDFLWNAQGEDVVSGRCPVQDSGGLQLASPDLYRALRQTSGQLERLFRDAQDFEFTVQEGRLYLLQSRNAKRTPWAALRIACELAREGLIDDATAIERLQDYDLNSIETARLAGSNAARPLCSGTPAGPGVAVGQIALDSESAVAMASADRIPILLREDISPDDITGLAAAAGVLTARGGCTSHAAVVARQLGKVCIVGCRELSVSLGKRGCRLGDRWLREGDYLSLDGHSGSVYEGKLAVVVEKPTQYLQEVEQLRARVAAQPPERRLV
jgi:pyruvate,orthophosphate dikinase